MIPANYDFTIYKGGTLAHKFTAQDTVGVTMDFTKYTAMRMQIRPILTGASSTIDPLVELTMVNGGLEKVETNLALMMNMTAEATAAIDFHRAQYDLELVVEEDGEPDIVDKFLRGKITVIEEVTV